jgi:hypothetical protein
MLELCCKPSFIFYFSFKWPKLSGESSLAAWLTAIIPFFLYWLQPGTCLEQNQQLPGQPGTEARSGATTVFSVLHWALLLLQMWQSCQATSYFFWHLGSCHHNNQGCLKGLMASQRGSNQATNISRRLQSPSRSWCFWSRGHLLQQLLLEVSALVKTTPDTLQWLRRISLQP